VWEVGDVGGSDKGGESLGVGGFGASEAVVECCWYPDGYCSCVGWDEADC